MTNKTKTIVGVGILVVLGGGLFAMTTHMFEERDPKGLKELENGTKEQHLPPGVAPDTHATPTPTGTSRPKQ